jgi:hypothetical protein
MNACVATLEESFVVKDQRDALLHIAKKIPSFNEQDESEETLLNSATNLLNKDLFPHMGKTKEDFPNKAKYLGYVAYKILLVHLGFAGIMKPHKSDNNKKRKIEIIAHRDDMIWQEN